MRIAISGTHCMGKTTLIEDFLKPHPEFTFEAEPYYQLQEKHDMEFSEEPTLEEFIVQLDYSIERLEELGTEENVIFERCPLDFLAYSMHLIHQEDLNLQDSILIEKLPEIIEALETLDLIVFLPMTSEHPIMCPESEDQSSRKAVDKYLKEIYRENLLDILPPHHHPHVIEIWGSPRTRLQKLMQNTFSL